MIMLDEFDRIQEILDSDEDQDCYITGGSVNDKKESLKREALLYDIKKEIKIKNEGTPSKAWRTLVLKSDVVKREEGQQQIYDYDKYQISGEKVHIESDMNPEELREYLLSDICLGIENEPLPDEPDLT